MNLKIFLTVLTLQSCAFCFAQEYKIAEICDISYVPSSFPVGFALVTHGDRQYVAYYDSAKNMTVACRKLNSKKWDYKILDNKIGWDSHNYVTMKIDSKGYLHVVGNMHAVHLIYYRSAKPLDIRTLTRIPTMIGTEEDRMTYPVFMNGPGGEFLFHYRHGSSGNGYEVYNIWNPETGTWKRFLDKPLIDGKGERNAYMQGPIAGPDKYWHLIWVWRETPDCATNHTLSYARSKDLLHWENAAGTPIQLPITIDEKSLYVDDTPPGGGLFNPGIRLGFDASGKAFIGYHKYDKAGNTQLFISRCDGGNWSNKQITDWDFKWIFQGGGSIAVQLALRTPKVLPDGRIAFGYWRADIGDNEVLLDGKTLERVGERKYTDEYPESLDKLESAFPEMSVRKTSDSGKSPRKNESYLLRWETLSQNRDRKREGELPPPSVLRVYKIVKGS